MRTNGSPQAYRDRVHDLVWSLWAELGVSGWQRDHSHWIIDPEELLVFTAWLGNQDARLWEECVDWCILFGDYLSVDRLKNILPRYDEATKASFGEIAATVRNHKGSKLPHPSRARRGYKPSRKSARPDVGRPSLIVLRLRKILGIGAKAEILSRLMLAPIRRFSINELVADGVGFARVTVAQALDDLVESKIVQVDRRNRDSQFQLSGRRGLLEGLDLFFGWRPQWRAIFRLLCLGDSFLSTKPKADERVAMLDDLETCREIEGVVRDVGASIAQPGEVEVFAPLIAAGLGLLSGGGRGLVGGMMVGGQLFASSKRSSVGSWLTEFADKLAQGRFPEDGSVWRLGPDEFRLFTRLRRVRDSRVAAEGWRAEFGTDELLRKLALRRPSTGKEVRVLADPSIELDERLVDEYAAEIQSE